MRYGWWLALALSAASVYGCGDEETGVGALGTACNVSDDCALEPKQLDCMIVGTGTRSSRMCTTTCTSNAECSAFGSGVACVADEGKCMYTCENGKRCPNGGECVAPNKCFP